jgi:hypothetical protein
VSVCVFPLSLLGNGSVNTFPLQRMNATVEESLDASFSVRSVSYQTGVWVCLCIPLSLLSNGSINTSPWQRRIGGIAFYAVHVVSGSRRLVLSRTSCLFRWCELHLYFAYVQLLSCALQRILLYRSFWCSPYFLLQRRRFLGIYFVLYIQLSSS